VVSSLHVILRPSRVSGFRGYEGVESKEACKDKEATGCGDREAAYGAAGEAEFS